MSRAERRREARRGGRTRSTSGGQRHHPVWILGVCAGAALLVVAAVAQFRGAPGHHPTPRAPEMAADVVSADRYEEYPRVQQTYVMAAAVPHVLDGLYCYCHCAEHSGHYSLLDCFSSDHAARCDVCMSEAVIAYDMTQQGASLDQIREVIDSNYRS